MLCTQRRVYRLATKGAKTFLVHYRQCLERPTTGLTESNRSTGSAQSYSGGGGGSGGKRLPGKASSEGYEGYPLGLDSPVGGFAGAYSGRLGGGGAGGAIGGAIGGWGDQSTAFTTEDDEEADRRWAR